MTKFERIVQRVIGEQFPGVAIERIIARPGVDSDGDEVLRIAIVFDAPPESLDSDKLAGLVRHLRVALGDDERFPLVSFIAKREAKSRLAPA